MQLCYNEGNTHYFDLVIHDVNNLFPLISNGLSPRTFTLLQTVASISSRLDMPLFLVGGPVRDLILGFDAKDIDLVVQGNAITLASETALELGAKVITHPQFESATLNISDQRLDLLTARTEQYSHPGALPCIQYGTIDDDLHRRDFSINAMAIVLSSKILEPGTLLDPHNGKVDLEHRIIRNLHSKSFVDDPTRLFRAIRYEQRLSFSIENNTLAAFKAAIDDQMIHNLSADRIRQELQLYFKEELPDKALIRANELGILGAIYTPLSKSFDWDTLRTHKGKIESLGYLSVISYGLSDEEGDIFIHTLNMPRQWTRIVKDTINLKARETLVIQKGSSPSGLYEILKDFLPVTIRTVALITNSEIVRDRLNIYVNKLSYTKPSLNGNDLITLGVPQGFMVGTILKKLKYSLLDGTISTREEEIMLVQDIIPSLSASPNIDIHSHNNDKKSRD